MASAQVHDTEQHVLQGRDSWPKEMPHQAAGDTVNHQEIPGIGFEDSACIGLTGLSMLELRARPLAQSEVKS